jgi:FemAB-related protein (PEP-CTERM system-associated)
MNTTILTPRPIARQRTIEVHAHDESVLGTQLPRLAAYATRNVLTPLSRHPAWLGVLHHALRHDVYCLEAMEDGRTAGILPLAFVRSLLFGRFLVSLPYLNSCGVSADDEEVQRRLIERALELADELQVRYLELRHEQPIRHVALSGQMASKVHMRLALATTAGQLWDQLPAKVRNQVRKGQKNGLEVTWGGGDVLSDFYAVFSTAMRDLGTPVYGRSLFAEALRHFPDRVECCIVRAGRVPVAAAILLHGWGVTEVPSAACLKQYHPSCANMLMYWHLLQRAVQRRQEVFDFGRSTVDGNTFRFKKQWGAQAEPAVWQYYLRHGTIADMRPDNPRYQRAIRLWQRLPVALTRLIGPAVVRGIP